MGKVRIISTASDRQPRKREGAILVVEPARKEFKTKTSWIVMEIAFGVEWAIFAMISPYLGESLGATQIESLVIAGVSLAYSALKLLRALLWVMRPRIRITGEGFELAASFPSVSYAWATIEGIDWAGKNHVDFRLINGDRISLMLYLLSENDRRAFLEIAGTALKERKGNRT